MARRTGRPSRPCADTSSPASSASRRGRSWGACCAGSRRRRSPARRAIASRLSQLARSLRENRDSVIVDCAIYQNGRRRDGDVDLAHAYRECREEGCFAWIGLFEPTSEEFASLSQEFDLHPLAVEDADPRAPAAEARDVRGHGAAGAEDGPLRGSDRGGEPGRDPRFRGRGLRDHRPARRGERPARRARAARGQPGAPEVGAGRGRARDRGQGRGRLPARDRRSRGGRGAGGDRGVLALLGRTARSASTGSSARRSPSTTPPLR